MEKKHPRLNSLLFDNRTTYLTDFQPHALEATIKTVPKKKKEIILAPFLRKDIHTLTSFQKYVPFDLGWQPKPIIRTKPLDLQKPFFKSSLDPDLDNIRRTRPRIVMAGAYCLDGIEDPQARSTILKDVYTSNYTYANERVKVVQSKIIAPLPQYPAPSRPIYLPELKPHKVEPEWLWDTVTWDAKQARGPGDLDYRFWKEKNIYKSLTIAIPGSIQEAGVSRSGSVGGSAGSGYESEPRDHSGSEYSWGDQDRPLKYGIFIRKISGKNVQYLVCPTCGHETELPLDGIAALPLNMVLMRKLLAAEDDGTASVLCDLCTSDNKAESRCSECLVSVCASCREAHGRHRATASHALHPLNASAAKFCSQHVNAELSIYCATCQKVICRECCILAHSSHARAPASHAAAERARLLEDACARARFVPDHVQTAVRALNMRAVEVDNHCAKVESEVATFAEEYRRAVEAHGRQLASSAARARARYRQRFEQRTRALEAQADHAEEAVRFAEEVLTHSTEDELLSLSTPILRRLSRLCSVWTRPPSCALRLTPGAPAGSGAGAGAGAALGANSLCGRLETSEPSAAHCLLDVTGLQDLRVDCKHEAVLELRDGSGERVWSGGEQVAGYFRRRDSSAPPAGVPARDRGDGTYALLLCPGSPGAYYFAVTLNNKPIKGSPFPCAVRVARAHTGQFHCCAFCSSGGKKDAVCGCGAPMGGPYKGCGHGHRGHPGARHWSCCGSTVRRGLCTRPHDHTYQFSL